MPKTSSLAPDHVLKGGWYTLFVVIILLMVGNVDRQVLIITGQPIAANLDLSDNEIGLVQGFAFALFTILAVYPIAWAADRFDRRIVMGVCVLIWSAGTAGCGLATNFEQLFLCAVAIAAGQASILPVAMSFTPELFKGRKRQVANSLLYFFAFVGMALGLGLSGGVIALLDRMHADLPMALQHFESWRLAFFAVSLPTPIVLLLLIFARLGHGSRTSATPSEKVPRPDIWPYIWRHKTVVGPVLGAIGFYALGACGFFVWTTVVTARLFGTSPSENGTFLGLATAIGIGLGVSIGTYAVRRLTVELGFGAPIRFYRWAMLAGIPVFALFPLTGAAWQVFSLFALMMVVFTAGGCAIPTILQDLAPPQFRARMSAIYTIIFSAMDGLASMLTGALSTGLGSNPRTLLIILALIAVPCWLIAAFLFHIAEKPFSDLAALVAAGEPTKNQG